jgi:hypothetical protein
MGEWLHISPLISITPMRCSSLCKLFAFCISAITLIGAAFNPPKYPSGFSMNRLLWPPPLPTAASFTITLSLELYTVSSNSASIPNFSPFTPAMGVGGGSPRDDLFTRGGGGEPTGSRGALLAAKIASAGWGWGREGFLTERVATLGGGEPAVEVIWEESCKSALLPTRYGRIYRLSRQHPRDVDAGQYRATHHRHSCSSCRHAKGLARL